MPHDQAYPGRPPQRVQPSDHRRLPVVFYASEPAARLRPVQEFNARSLVSTQVPLLTLAYGAGVSNRAAVVNALDDGTLDEICKSYMKGLLQFNELPPETLDDLRAQAWPLVNGTRHPVLALKDIACDGVYDASIPVPKGYSPLALARFYARVSTRSEPVKFSVSLRVAGDLCDFVR